MARKETSYGIIPIRKVKGKWELLLIQHNKGHWSFPKGHPEAGETPLITAERELKEETSLTVAKLLSDKPFIEHYFFTWQGEKIDKTVHYYLAEVEGQVFIDPVEISAYCWTTFEDAATIISFSEGRRICREAANLLSLRESLP